MLKCLVISDSVYLFDMLYSVEALKQTFIFTKSLSDQNEVDVIIADKIIDKVDTPIISFIARPISIKEVINELTKFSEQSNKNVTFGDITLDKSTRLLISKENSIQLTEIESKILKGLIIAENNYLARDDIKTTILGYNQSTQTNTIENHIHHLRSKLAEIKSDVAIDSSNNAYSLIVK